jgi:hypothetical protein
MATDAPALQTRLALVGALVILALYGGLGLAVDFRTAAGGFQSDEATYHLMAHSLAADGDLEYRREDLVRAFREFPSGPSGIFLKKGTDVNGVGLMSSPPFIAFPGTPDPDATRLYFGKSFVYPLAAAPFVWLLGTNGFLVLNALLLAAAFVATYTFTAVRSGPVIGLLWASAFVFASVIPVYAIWIAPELFNWALAVLAYFLWLFKLAGPAAAVPARGAWLTRPWTDILATALIGVLTFSKVTNVLLLVPMVLWWLYTRAWRRATAAVAAWAVVTALGFGGNVVSSGEWNYQGGDRATCYDTFPFQDPARGLEVCAERARNEALGSVIFDREVFWTNLRANLGYFFAGRNSGLVLYYFPAAFAIVALFAARRARAPWQWLVLAGVVIQILLFVVTLPYSYFGGGGTVGNRYFSAVYGICAFLLPAVHSARWLIIPWLVGGLFTAQLVLNPFQVSLRPADHPKSPLFKRFPVELTNLNALPLMTQADRVRIWYGNSGAGDPGFQIYYLDDNSYLQEADKLSFWTRGESSAQFAIKTDKPYSKLRLTLSAGAVATVSTVKLNGRVSEVRLGPGQSSTRQLALGPGFPYKEGRERPAYVWVLDVSSTTGFVPAVTDGSHDRRFLGVRVQPIILE